MPTPQRSTEAAFAPKMPERSSPMLYDLERVIAFTAVFIDPKRQGTDPELLRNVTGSDKKILTGTHQLDPERISKLIPAGRVSDVLLKNIGIGFETEDGHPKITPLLCEKLLVFFSTLKKLDENVGYRVAYVADPENTLRVAGLQDNQLHGSVFHRVMGGTSRKPSLHFHQNLYSAVRATFHRKEDHVVETEALTDFLRRVDRMVTMLAIYRNFQNVEKDGVKRESVELARDFEEQLGKSQDKGKQRALRLGTEAAGLKDALDRVNILGSRSRYESCAQRLVERISAIPRITHYSKEDQVSLVGALLHQESTLRSIVEAVDSAAKRFKNHAKPRRQDEINDLFRSLGLTDENLAPLVTRPFANIAFALKGLRSRLEQNCKANAVNDANEIYDTTVAFLKFASSEIWLGHARFSLMSGKDGAINARSNIVRAHTYLGDINAPARFSAIPKILEDAAEKCRLLATCRPDEEKSYLKYLDAALSAASVDAILGSIS